MKRGFSGTTFVKGDVHFFVQGGRQLLFSKPGDYERTADVELSPDRAAELFTLVFQQILQMCVTGQFDVDRIFDAQCLADEEEDIDDESEDE